MRCRRVRSYLSAFCNDELTGRKKLSVGEHLENCSECRRVRAEYTAINENRRDMPHLKVSKDFNNLLLNRIGQERFAETRTKAYMPKNAPVVRWAAIIPVIAAACLVFAVTMSGIIPNFESTNQRTTAYNENDDIYNAYLTVQPDKNPNMTHLMNKDWSLTTQLAKADRIDQMSQKIIEQIGINAGQSQGMTNVSSKSTSQVPYGQTYYRVRPVIKIYQTTESQRGASSAY